MANSKRCTAPLAVSLMARGRLQVKGRGGLRRNNRLIYPTPIQNPRFMRGFFHLIVPKMGTIIPNMGMKKISIADALFSRVQQRVLALLFDHPDKGFYTNEIIRATESGTGAVQRELAKLLAAKLIIANKLGNQIHYQVNSESPLFVELRGIILKTFGLADVIKHALKPVADKIQI